MKTEYGFYSAKAAAQFGYAIYLMADGTKALITKVTPDKEGDDYRWDDKVLVGEVKHFVSSQII